MENVFFEYIFIEVCLGLFFGFCGFRIWSNLNRIGRGLFSFRGFREVLEGRGVFFVLES